MVMGKSQATIFVILALVIIAVIALVFSFRGNIITKAKETGILPSVNLPPELNVIQEDIEDCLKDVGLSSLILIGDQGGYIYLDGKKSLDYSNGKVAYLYYQGSSFVPSKEEMESDLKDYMEEAILKCKKDYEGFDKTTYGNTDVDVTIKSDSVTFDIVWPVTLSKGDAPKSVIKDFGFSYDIRLGEVRDIIEEIVSLQEADTENICLSCIYEMAKKRNFNVMTDNFNYNAGDLLYWIVIDYKLGETKHNYIFSYANKF